MTQNDGVQYEVRPCTAHRQLLALDMFVII